MGGFFIGTSAYLFAAFFALFSSFFSLAVFKGSFFTLFFASCDFAIAPYILGLNNFGTPSKDSRCTITLQRGVQICFSQIQHSNVIYSFYYKP